MSLAEERKTAKRDKTGRITHCIMCDEKLDLSRRKDASVCNDPLCLQAYNRNYKQDHRPPGSPDLKEIVSRWRDCDGSTWRKLECGHTQEEPPGGRSAKATKAFCLSCKTLARRRAS